MPNVDLVKKDKVSSFRRIAIGTWKTAYDPSVYGSLTLRMDEALRYLEEFREKTGRRLTITHMMAKAVSGVLQEMPDANAILRWNRLYLRKDIGVFFQVAMKDEATGEIDLSGATIHHADAKSLLQVYDEFAETVRKVRKQEDETLEQTRSTFKKIPYFLLNTVLNTLGFLTYTLNWDMRWAGIAKDIFGSVMVTNVGSLGLEEAWVPLVPYSRVPLLVALGTVDRKVLVNPDTGEMEVGTVMKVCATFDHRVLDGSHAAVMSRTLRMWMEDPYTWFGPIPDLGGGEET